MKGSLKLLALLVSASFCLQASAGTSTADSGANTRRQALNDANVMALSRNRLRLSLSTVNDDRQYKVPSTQSNFTVLVSLSDLALKTVANGGHVANANGYDIGSFTPTPGGVNAQVGSLKIRWHNRQPDRMGKDPLCVQFNRHGLLPDVWR